MSNVESGEYGAGEKARRSMRAGGVSITSDPTYDLVSVLYHALQGAETSIKYIADAEAAGDDELGQFFQEVHEQEEQRANKAKHLLVRCLEREETETSGEIEQDIDPKMLRDLENAAE